MILSLFIVIIAKGCARYPTLSVRYRCASNADDAIAAIHIRCTNEINKEIGSRSSLFQCLSW